jgi:hypothetical protein
VTPDLDINVRKRHDPETAGTISNFDGPQVFMNQDFARNPLSPIDHLSISR